MTTYPFFCQQLAEANKLQAVLLTVPRIYPDHEHAAVAKIFDGKTEKRCGIAEMAWSRWLTEGVFPMTLYQIHGEDLQAMIDDPRFYSAARYAATDAWNSFFGRMARPRPPIYPRGFLDYAIRRMCGRYATQPNYYFDVESPEWVWEELNKGPETRPKTWRSSASCVMNIAFRVVEGTLSTHLIVKHMQWSHSWGDYSGAWWITYAMAKATGLQHGVSHIYAISATNDDPKLLKQFIKEL